MYHFQIFCVANCMIYWDWWAHKNILCKDYLSAIVLQPGRNYYCACHKHTQRYRELGMSPLRATVLPLHIHTELHTVQLSLLVHLLLLPWKGMEKVLKMVILHSYWYNTDSFWYWCTHVEKLSFMIMTLCNNHCIWLLAHLLSSPEKPEEKH